MASRGKQRKAQERAEALVATHAETVLRLACAYLGSRAEAEDVLQDVLVKLALEGRTFADAEHERAWVVAITRNACLDVLRSSRWRAVDGLDASEDLADVSDEVLAVLEAQDVLAAVSKLPLAYREAIHLHYYEGYSASEIAEMTGEKTSAVTKRLSRARALLRERLG